MSRAVLIIAFLFSLQSSIIPSEATETHVSCLRYIKQSFEDPFGHIASWVFIKNTQGSICRFKGVKCWHSQARRVLGINLSGLGLKGQFPLGIQNCTGLKKLNLSNNELEGSIPADIGMIIPSITSLDLSSNKFSGEIPSTFADCSYLNVLKLDNNRLTGNIPKEINHDPQIRIFSVANNSLSGQVPNFVNGSISRRSLADNPGPFGQPLESCEHRRWSHDSFRTGLVIGYAVSFLAVIFALRSCDLPPWLSFKITNKVLKPKRKIKRKQVNKEIDFSSADNLYLGWKEIHRLEKMVPRMAYTDLRNATNNFSEKNLMGIGKVGITFKATLPTGHFLAVKKLHYNQFLDEQFTAELKILGTLRHINLVPLVGFCIKSNEKYLVYKYMPNGRLCDWLNPIKDKSKIIGWPLRAKIAVGLARGLAWLHQGCHIHVAHLSISSKCILLDHKFEPKLSNFGEAIFMIPSSNPSRNHEFWEMAFVKEDVYSFGVVLLELITGEDSSKNSSNSTESYNGSPNDWVHHLLNRNSSTFHDLIDKYIIGQEFDDEINKFLEIALTCVQAIPDQRPTMQQVYQQINKVGKSYGLFDDSELLIKNDTLFSGNKGKSVEIEIIEI